MTVMNILTVARHRCRQCSRLPRVYAKNRLMSFLCSHTPLQQAQRALYNGVLEEHLKQKAEAIKRALMRDKPNGCDGIGAEDAFISTMASKTRSKSSGVVGDKGVVDMDTDANGGGSNGMLEAAGFGSKEIKNIFTELRKAANHPLMLMNHFKGGGKVEEVVNVLHRASFFGGQATREMVGGGCFYVIHIIGV